MSEANFDYDRRNIDRLSLENISRFCAGGR